MSKIIALFPGNLDIHAPTDELVATGIPPGNIQVLTHAKAIQESIGCDPICTVRNYAIWGVLLVGVIYSIFGLVASWCECNLMGFDQPFGMLTLVGGVLAGGLVGGVLGAIIGLAESDQETHLYVQGARRGGKVILVETQAEGAEQTKQILRQAGSTGVKTLR